MDTGKATILSILFEYTLHEMVNWRAGTQEHLSLSKMDIQKIKMVFMPA